MENQYRDEIPVETESESIGSTFSSGVDPVGKEYRRLFLLTTLVHYRAFRNRRLTVSGERKCKETGDESVSSRDIQCTVVRSYILKEVLSPHFLAYVLMSVGVEGKTYFEMYTIYM